MNVEQPSTQDDKPLNERLPSQMTTKELEALLAERQAAEQPTEDQKKEVVDTSYLEMASGEKFPSKSHEDQERVAQEIAKAEDDLGVALGEMRGVVDRADQAFTDAQETLKTNPNAIEPKLTMEKIRDAYDKAQAKLKDIALAVEGTLGAAFTATLIGAGETMPSAVDIGNPQTHEIWVKAMEGSLASLYAAGAAFAIGYAINKFKHKKAESRYYSQKYSQA